MEETFERITLADREEMTPLLSGFRFVDLGFTGLYYCAEAFDIRRAYICGALCLRIRGDEGVCYVVSDTLRLAELAALLIEREHADSLAFDFVEEADVQKFEALDGYSCKAEFVDKYSDYFSLYSDYIAVDKRASLHKYKDYNQFCSRFAHETHELTAKNITIARELLDRWCAGRSCESCTTGCEKQWIERIFDSWDKLPAKGLIVDVDGEPAGFCVLEKNRDTVLRLVSKPAGGQRGLQVFMGVESAKTLFPDAKYVNLGPDSGVEGLRVFKDKFRPYIKLKKYRVTLTRI